MEFTKSYIGNQEVLKVYIGTELVWESAPSTLTPTMTNFRVEDATPTLVHFDTPNGSVDGISATDFTISGSTISAVNTTDNYFTLSSALNYWDNNTIRKEGGNNDVVYDFTLESISNNIPVPTIAPANYRYVAENGSDSANGETEGTAWLTLKHALQTTPSGGGYQIWVKVGTYLNENIVQADMDNGAEGAPYRITGYKSTIGDITSNYYTLTPNTAYPALDDTEMPLFDGGDSSVGRFIYNDSRNYYIWENLQVTGYAEAFRSRFSNVQGQQVINCNIKDIGVIASNYGYGVYWVNESNNADRNRVVNTNFMNIESNAIAFDGEFNLAKGCKVYSQNGTTGGEGTDYYYQMESSNNIIKDCLAYNDGNGGHNGHGFSCKTSGSGVDEEVHYNLIDGCEAVAIQGAFQARHANCKFNVWKNSIARADIPNRKEGSSDNYTGCIDFQSGGDQNVFENLTCHDTHQFIRFNLNGESDTDPDIQTNALIKNCLVYDVKNVIDANSVIAGVSAPNGNKLANCTIKGAENMFWQWAGTGSVEFGLNKIENCIIENVPTLNKDEVVVGWTYSYDFSWDIWLANGTPITGTGNESMDTLLNASYQPQATFTDIDVPRIDNVFYGKNEVERQDPTTVGSVLSASEIPSEPPVTDYDFYVSATGTGDGLTSDTPMSFADSQTIINSMSPGESIAYKGGDEFHGSLSISGVNGASGNPITFTSYGTGQANITGRKDISGWSTSGGNIWTASTGADTPYQVFKSGEAITMGRMPKIAADNAPKSSYYTVSSDDVGSKTTFSSGTGTGLATSGASIHISSASWVLEARTLSSYNSSTGACTWAGNVQYTLGSGDRYFFNNHISFCTTQDEWYYNSGVLSIYSTSEPTDISISTVSDNGIDISSSSYLTFDNLNISDFGTNGVDVLNSNNIVVENSTMKYNYNHSVNFNNSTDCLVDNNVIHGNTVSAFGLLSDCPDISITNNTITGIGRLKTITTKAMVASDLVEFNAPRGIFTGNTATNIGYIGVIVRGLDCIVTNNLIENACLTLDDGAAFYSHNGDWTDVPPQNGGPRGSVISNNIAVGLDFASSGWYAEGFYTDDRSRGVTIEYNTAINCNYGYFMHNNIDIIFRYNNLYANNAYSIYMYDDIIDGGVGEMVNNTVTYNNIFHTSIEVNREKGAIAVRSGGTAYDFGTIDFNKYFVPYYNEQIRFGTSTIHGGGGTWDLLNFDLDTWNSSGGYGYAQGWDANSEKDNLSWTYPEADTKSQCVYNATNSPVITPLVGTWYGMDGTEYIDEITLEPFTSEILINELAAPPVPTGELYPSNDAASIDNEANLVASEWSYNGSVSIASSAVDPQSGLYCLELTADLSGSGYFRGLQLDLEAGETYNYSFYAKGETGAARSRAWFGVVSSPDHSITTSWVQYTGTFEVTTGLVTINFQPDAAAVTGDTMFVDTFTITKV